MKCCTQCFNDNELEWYIYFHLTDRLPQCDLCNSKDVDAISAEQLIDYLSPLVDLYPQSDEQNSIPIWTHLKQDWKILKNVSDENCKKLFSYVFPEKCFGSKKFVISQGRKKKSLNWNDFKEELRHENRFFPKKGPNLNDLKILFEYLIFKEKIDITYRARIKEGFSLRESDMGKPEGSKAKYGRANPFGISYLYSASDPNTAIAEVRPQVGDQVCVVKLKIKNELNLLDFRDPKEKISPFVMGDLLKILNNNLDLLYSFGNELSKPVRTSSAHFDYLASQYLCELIKSFNYDGVVYKSSVSRGNNFAFFNDESIEIQEGSLKTFQIDSIEYKKCIYN